MKVLYSIYMHSTTVADTWRGSEAPYPLPLNHNINYVFILGFLLELQKDRSKMADAVTLLSVADQIHILLIKTSPSGERTLVGSHNLKWRTILAAEGGCLRNSIEINGVGTEAKVPVGVLDMKLEIIPRLVQVRIERKGWVNHRYLQPVDELRRMQIIVVKSKGILKVPSAATIRQLTTA